MAYEKKDGDITLFANKKTKETQPDFKGTVLIDGKELDVALWKRTSQSGKDFLSGKVTKQLEKKQYNGVQVKDDNVDELNF